MMTAQRTAAFRALLDYPELIESARVEGRWLPDHRLMVTQGAPQNTRIMAFDPVTSDFSDLLDVTAVRQAYADEFGHAAPYDGLPFELVTPVAEGYVAVISGRECLISSDGTKLKRTPKPSFVDQAIPCSPATRMIPQSYYRPSLFPDSQPSPEMFSPDGRWASSIRASNLAVRSLIDGRTEILTTDGSSLVSWDVESSRIAIGPGATLVNYTMSPWSPDSLMLIATRVDKSGSQSFSRTHFASRTDEIEEVWLTRAGDILPTTTPYVFHLLSRKAVQLQVAVEDRLFLPLGWSQDSAVIYFAQFSRDQSWMGLYGADPNTGSSTLLIEEFSDTFLRIQHEVLQGKSGITVLSGNRGFIWESDRDGWSHFYHYDINGTLVRQLTSGQWAAMDILRVDDGQDAWVYFSAHHDQSRPYDIHICRVPLSGGQVERISNGNGIHDAQFSPCGAFVIDTVSKPDLAPQSTLRKVDGLSLKEFQQTDLARLRELGWVDPEEFSVKAADGITDLYGVLIKPADFDPTKKYPVIEWIYGGPQLAYAPHHFPLFALKQATINWALPQLGYVVVMLDARGTPERSKAFQDVTYKEWRRHLTADHATAIKNLAADRSWIDIERVGLWGHSWGGYSTVACLLDAPDVFKAGIASAPGFNPYDAFIYEPYLGGIPSSSTKAAYDDALLYSDAAKLNRELMIVAGTNDVTVWQNAIKMSRALIEAGRQHELVALPGQHHGYFTPYENYFIEKFVNFFADHLGGMRLNGCEAN